MVFICITAFPALGFSQASIPGLSEETYTPRDYPNNADFFEVTVNDNFWEPLMRLNADIAIPHVFTPGNTRGSLEAAIYSQLRYPNPELKAQIDDYFESQKEAQATEPTSSYRLFESVVAYYKVFGDKELLDSFRHCRLITCYFDGRME
jgi:hypothetical protein